MRLLEVLRGVWYSSDNINRVWVYDNIEGNSGVKIHIEPYGEFVLKVFPTRSEAEKYARAFVNKLNKEANPATD